MNLYLARQYGGGFIPCLRDKDTSDADVYLPRDVGDRKTSTSDVRMLQLLSNLASPETICDFSNNAGMSNWSVSLSRGVFDVHPHPPYCHARHILPCTHLI